MMVLGKCLLPLLFLPPTSTPLRRSHRFVLTSTSQVKQRQAKDADAIKAEMENLNKKLNYLEMTFKNSREHMEALFQRGA